MDEYNRIISLVPSLTELLFDLGLEDKVVGRTRFCVHPKSKVEKIPIVGGTKNPRLDKIRELDPDYIIANREENRKEHIENLSRDFEVQLTDIATIENALIAIHTIGKKLDALEKADRLISDINKVLDERPAEPPRRVAYFIWKDPWMTVGGDTYIHDVLSHWDLDNVYGDQPRYPKVNFENLSRRNPDMVFLSSEPYPFKEKHLAEVEQALPDSRILLVEGEWFSWYGSHMLHSFKRLNVWRKAIA